MNELPDVKGKRVLVRVDFNVPITDGIARAEDADRVFAHLETIDYLANAGARVIVISHIGRAGETLSPVADLIELVRPVTLASDVIGPDAQAKAAALTNGQILLLENVRRESGEEKNDPVFAKALAAFGDLFVLDAFSAAHRAHTSIVGVAALLPSYAGFVFENEYNELSPLLTPESPFVLALGGAKFETKLPIISSYKDRATLIVLGGALLNSVLVARGYSVGQSLVDASVDLSQIKDLRNLFVPERVLVKRPGGVVEVSLDQIAPTDVIVDIAPIAWIPIAMSMRSAKTILWGGPMGIVEQGATAGTKALIDIFKTATDAARIAGGGDTAAFLEREKLTDAFSYVSLAGGAMLDFLADGTLPGITALDESEDRG
jgi:phosphoglycerate kinase